MRYLGRFSWQRYARDSSSAASARCRLPVALVAVVLAAVLLPVGARAGGWAVVTLDGVPQAPYAGQVLSLGFMVRQHGVTPIDAPYGQGALLQPVLTARNTDTGETVVSEARKEGPVGHFVVEIAFPNAGTWSWTITPAPFAGTTLEPLTVAPSPPAPRAGSGATTPVARLLDPAPLWVVGLALVLAALLFGVIARRHLPRRRFVFRPR